MAYRFPTDQTMERRREIEERQRFTEDAFQDLSESIRKAVAEATFWRKRCEELEQELELALMKVDELKLYGGSL